MRRMKKKAALLLLIAVCATICSNAVYATGAPVFDLENWLYSILQYTQMGTDTANFVTNMKREIQQAEKLYKAISEGDILSAISSITRYTNRLEKKLGQYGVQSEIFSQLVNLQNASADWANHMDDPDYFSSVLDELKVLQCNLSAAAIEAGEDLKAEAREEADESGQTSGSLVAMDSATEIGNKTVIELQKSNARKSHEAVDSKTMQLSTDNAELAQKLAQDAEYARHIALRNAAEAEALANTEANFQPIDVNLTDPFEGL